MKCGPNYILSDALQQALPSEKLISECPLHPVSITFLFQMHQLPSFLLMCNVEMKGNTVLSSWSCPKDRTKSSAA